MGVLVGMLSIYDNEILSQIVIIYMVQNFTRDLLSSYIIIFFSCFN
jgi:hypothetical protein